ncbi:Phenylacetate-coenzyme A ligase [Desulfovibrio sp. DV]|uniref:phenylacetate--CoA ligase family protein n=1 Tax=Desulfovibrio sp. DV TaxID=1844708 RepID=UPI00094BACA9|nr:AMP-binding protein [Desulfovibrio sp. DV]OLN28911.1 Phenylacetate-coenzyme A ligase [Desulfovibrio sp. DV]
MDAAKPESGFYNPLESMDREAAAARKFDRLRRLISHAYKRSEEFKARLDGAGLTPDDVASWDDFARIPPLGKKQLLALQDGGAGLARLLTGGVAGLRRIYQSPGPLYDPEGPGPDYWGWAEAFYAAGFARGDLVQMTFSYHLTPAGLMLEEPLLELGCTVIPAGPGNTDVQIDLMTRLPVTGFVGMASYLAVIADKARERGLDLHRDFRLRTAFVAAERLPESLRQKVQNAFAMTIRQGYGTADVGCIAYECAALTGMHVSSRGIVEICEPGTGRPLPPGEVGEVVFTPFADAYPLIRLATGDLSRLDDTPCPCGRTSPRLAGILGRADDTAKVKGQFIYPAQAAEVVAAFPAIVDWQIVIQNPGGKDTIEVRLCCREPLDTAAFAARFQERLKLRPQVTVLPSGENIVSGSPKLLDERRFE